MDDHEEAVISDINFMVPHALGVNCSHPAQSKMVNSLALTPLKDEIYGCPFHCHFTHHLIFISPFPLPLVYSRCPIWTSLHTSFLPTFMIIVTNPILSEPIRLGSLLLRRPWILNQFPMQARSTNGCLSEIVLCLRCGLKLKRSTRQSSHLTLQFRLNFLEGSLFYLHRFDCGISIAA